MTDRLGQFRTTLATYRRHGWQLARALMTAQTLAELRRETQKGSTNEPPSQASGEDATRHNATADDATTDDATTEDSMRGDTSNERDTSSLDVSPRIAEDRNARAAFEGVPVSESDFDAMWFRRPAADGREAWELRLAAEPYALFELFEADEADEDREDVRRELEQRVQERTGGA